jgi:hypothetical protein
MPKPTSETFKFDLRNAILHAKYFTTRRAIGNNEKSLSGESFRRINLPTWPVQSPAFMIGRMNLSRLSKGLLVCLALFASFAFSGFVFAAEPALTNSAPTAAVDIVYPDITNRTDFAVSEEIQTAMKKLRLQPGFYAELFASEPFIVNPTSFTFDEQGRAYVVETHRRRTSVFDIRNHPDWLDADLSFRTPEDRANFLKRTLSPTNSALPKTIIHDRNGDGKFDWHDLEVESERIRLARRSRFQRRRRFTAITYADDFKTHHVRRRRRSRHAQRATYGSRAFPISGECRTLNHDGKADIRVKNCSAASACTSVQAVTICTA